MSAVLDQKIEAKAAVDSVQRVPSNPNIIALHELCAEWKKDQGFPAFSRLIKFCLDKDLIDLSYFREYFGVMPAFVIMWAAGSMEPPLTAQAGIVEFIDTKVETLPKREKRPNEAIARARLVKRMAHIPTI